MFKRRSVQHAAKTRKGCWFSAFLHMLSGCKGQLGRGTKQLEVFVRLADGFWNRCGSPSRTSLVGPLLP